MDFSVIGDNLSYFLLGAYPDVRWRRCTHVLVLSVSGVISALLGAMSGRGYNDIHHHSKQNRPE